MNEAGCQEYLKINFPSLDVPEFRNKVAQYVIEHGAIKKKQGADKLFKFLKDNNIKMAIASGTPAKTVLDNLKEVNIAHYFDVVVGGDMVENCKPAPDIFLLAAKKLGIDPQHCFVFEDSLNGIKAGYAAGMKCIGIPDMAAFNNEIKKLMKFELASLDEAIEIFKNYL